MLYSSANPCFSYLFALLNCFLKSHSFFLNCDFIDFIVQIIHENRHIFLFSISVSLIAIRLKIFFLKSPQKAEPSFHRLLNFSSKRSLSNCKLRAFLFGKSTWSTAHIKIHSWDYQNFCFFHSSCLLKPSFTSVFLSAQQYFGCQGMRDSSVWLPLKCILSKITQFVCYFFFKCLLS